MLEWKKIQDTSARVRRRMDRGGKKERTIGGKQKRCHNDVETVRGVLIRSPYQCQSLYSRICTGEAKRWSVLSCSRPDEPFVRADGDEDSMGNVAGLCFDETLPSLPCGLCRSPPGWATLPGARKSIYHITARAACNAVTGHRVKRGQAANKRSVADLPYHEHLPSCLWVPRRSPLCNLCSP